MFLTWIHHITDIAAAAVIFFTAAGTGRYLLAKAGIRFASPGERTVFGAAAGFGAMEYAVFLLGACGGLYRIVIFGMLAGLVPLAVAGWRSGFSRADEPAPGKFRIDPVSVTSLALLAVAIGAATLLALTPAVGNDALSYHLAVPKLYLENHGFTVIPGNIFSHYPLGTEMLYTVALAMNSEVSAKGLHLTFTLLTLMGMWQFARHRLGMSRCIPIALLIFFTIPSVFFTASMAYSDLAFAFYAFVAVSAFINWFYRAQRGWLALCGTLTGLAMATKYAGLLMPFLGMLGILWACRRRQATVSRAMVLLSTYLAWVFVAGAPHYLKNWMMTGNPFFPFFYKIFGGAGWGPDQSRRFDLFHHGLGMGRRLIDYLMLPWNVSVHAEMNSPRFDGVLGPIFILTLPFALSVRRLPLPLKIALVYSGVTFVFWAVTVQQIRYLIPIFPFLAIWVAHTLDRGRPKAATLVMMVCIAAGIGVNGVHIAKGFAAIQPIPVVVGTESRAAFYRRLVPAYPMFAYINTHLPATSKTFFIYMRNHGYLCDRPFYSDAIFESHTMENILDNADTPHDVYLALKKMGISHILYDIRYVFGERSLLSPRDKDLFEAFEKQYLETVKTEQHRYYLFRII